MHLQVKTFDVETSVIERQLTHHLGVANVVRHCDQIRHSSPGEDVLARVAGSRPAAFAAMNLRARHLHGSYFKNRPLLRQPRSGRHQHRNHPPSAHGDILHRAAAEIRRYYNEALRLGWLTDIHLNFLLPDRRADFYRRIAREKLDALLIGGDIGEAPSVGGLLTEIAAALPIPIYFVLGNHDFYRGSIAEVRDRISSLSAASAQLRWLPAAGIVPLTRDTALIGHDSWADGRFGDFFRSQVMLNDYVLIGEFRGLTRPQRFAKLNALGDEAAEYLERRAREAFANFKHLLVLTHVPPFREACWHEGKISDDEWLPHFACQAVGERLAALMRLHPEKSMGILCGHTHSPGVAEILPNLTVISGRADYGHPELQRIFDLA